MKAFHFSSTYFRKTIHEDPYARVRVVINEHPSLNVSEEEYSLRISTRFDDHRTIHRNYAIEHHLPPAPHSFPHLQFKFHTEEIGQFRIRIDIRNDDEYRRAILGFIHNTKVVLEDLERHSRGITKELLVLPLVNQLREEGIFLLSKIREGITRYHVDFDKKRRQKDSLGRLLENRLLLDFLGKEKTDLLGENAAK